MTNGGKQTFQNKGSEQTSGNQTANSKESEQTAAGKPPTINSSSNQ
jgi:hypothetical protein